MKRLALLAVLGSLGLLAGCGGATDSCGDNEDGNTDNIHQIIRVHHEDASDTFLVVCENGKTIQSP